MFAFLVNASLKVASCGGHHRGRDDLWRSSLRGVQIDVLPDLNKGLSRS